MSFNYVLVVALNIGSIICLRETRYFQYGRTLTCTEKNKQGCLLWQDQIQLYNIKQNFNYQCFSQEVYVLTQGGPISLNKLQVTDKILAYNFQQNKPQYSQVIAWLHRDTETYLQYSQIRTTDNNVYSASFGHNIAYQNNGTINFKLADNLKRGDRLIQIGQKQVVDTKLQPQFQKGLYSPYTQNGNFYVFPKFQKQVQNIWNRTSLILVHCLSQIKQPQHVKQHWFHFVMAQISEIINLNAHQNIQPEQYFHPATSLLTLFTENSKRSVKIKHLIITGKNDNQIDRARSVMGISLSVLQMTKICQISY